MTASAICGLPVFLTPRQKVSAQNDMVHAPDFATVGQRVYAGFANMRRSQTTSSRTGLFHVELERAGRTLRRDFPITAAFLVNG